MTHAERTRRVSALHAVACEHNAACPDARLACHIHARDQGACISFAGEGILPGRCITVNYGQSLKKMERSFRRFVRQGGRLSDCVAFCPRLRATLELPRAKAILV